MARDPGRAERSAMGSGHRGTVAGDAGEISAVPDRPPPIPAVGAQWEAGRSAEATGAASAPTRKAESGRSVRGCNLRERQKGGLAVGPTRRGKGTKIIAVAAGNSLPLAVSVDSASPAECQLVEYVLAGSFLDQLPARLVGDKAYDSDGLDRTLREEYGIEMIAPNRRNRSRSQDGRKLRRYRKRWKVERLFAWMHNFRRLVTRWEYHIENFLGFVHLACLHMLLRHL
jgi:transposase